MPNRYTPDPYASQYPSGSPQANGYAGMQKPGWSRNLNQQRSRKPMGTDSFGEAADEWRRVLTGYMQPSGNPTAPKPVQGRMDSPAAASAPAYTPPAPPSVSNGRPGEGGPQVSMPFTAPQQARFTTQSAALTNTETPTSLPTDSTQPVGGQPNTGQTPSNTEPPEIPFAVNNPDSEAYWRTRGGAPKPLNTEDPTVFASWARTFGDEFMYVTAEEVQDYRNNPNGMHFADWYRAKASSGGEIEMPVTGGKPTPPGGTPEAGTPPAGSVDPRVERYASLPGYEWIREQPGVIGAYEQEAQRLGQAGESGIDIADWLAAKGYPSPAAERGGFNSYYFRDANFTKREGVTLPPAPQNTEDANVAAQWYQQFGKAFEGMTGADVTRYRNWALQNGVTAPAGTGPDISQIANWWTKIDSVTRGGMFSGGQNPTQGTGPVTPAMPPAPELTQPPASTTPPTTTTTPPLPGEPSDTVTRFVPRTATPSTPFTAPPEPPDTPAPVPELPGGGPDMQPAGPGIGDAVKNLNSMFQPGFEREQERLLKLMMHQGGITGMTDSGGFSATVGDQLSGLIANQGQRMGDYMFKDKQNRDALTMQKYIADQDTRTRLKELETTAGMQRWQTEFMGALERDKIQTNADLQKWLAEKQDVFDRFKIDKNEVLQRYITDVESKDRRYAADAGVSAASLQVAAAGAAQAAAGAARQAEMEFQRERLKYEDVFNKRQYDLGILGINRDIYQTDLDNQYKLMMLQWYMSPEARMGGSFPSVPGMFPYGP